MANSNKQTLILIDGHALAYRAYFGMPATFSTRQGEPTHAVYGFTNMLLAVWHEYNPDYFIVTFDKGDTFRHKMFDEYKATREKMPDDLATQIERIEQLVRVFNMPVFAKDGYEADDLLGTLAAQAAAQNIEAYIVTGDRDAFQLVAPNIKVVISGKKFADREVYDEERVQTRYGVTPQQLIDMKALVGDTSDNIPGVKGIGEKGAAKLIQTYGTLEAIYDNLDNLTKGTRTKLTENRDNAFLSRDLGRIITNVPDIALDTEAGRTQDFDFTEVANLFVELEFNTIFQRIPNAPPDKLPQDLATIKPPPPMPLDNQPPPSTEDSAPPPDGRYITVDQPHQLADLVAALKASPQLAVDVETDGTNETEANLVGIAITPVARQGYYIPLRHGLSQTETQASMFEGDTATEETQPSQLSLDAVQQALAPILADAQTLKFMHNAKFDMTVLERHGLPVQPPIFDTMIAAWLSNNAPDVRYGLKELARNELGLKMTPIKSLIGSGKKQITMDQVAIETVTPYAGADVDLTLRLADIIKPRLTPTTERILNELELPLIYVLKDMEMTGIKLDVAVLQAMSVQLTQQLHTLTEQIHEVAGRTFNLNSTQQLSDVLFDELMLPTARLKKTKSGHYSTAAGVLESLQGTHKIIDFMLDYRQLSKLKSTYVDALPALINPQTGRVHTSYSQVGVSTGRLASMNPNLQNIPIRTPQGREIRRAFMTEPGWRLIAADYSQVELRILAHVANDPGLLAAFNNDEDIHAATAANVLGVPIDEIDKDQRRIAKAVNFGLVYGQTAFGLAQGTSMSQKEARQFIDTYFEKYPGVQQYINQTKQLAAEQEYVTTLTGRVRQFPGLARLRGPQRGRMEREAINAPIQGTAADIMKQAMIDLHAALQQRHYRSRMLLQVHDELVLEAPEEEVDAVSALVRRVMSEAFELQIPLKVEVEVGDNWLEMTTV